MDVAGRGAKKKKGKRKQVDGEVHMRRTTTALWRSHQGGRAASGPAALTQGSWALGCSHCCVDCHSDQLGMPKSH